jgi:hypothetical protein
MWRDTLLVDVPMRPARTAERTEHLSPDDPRFVDGVVLITDGGMYLFPVTRAYAGRPLDSMIGGISPARASYTIQRGVRAIGRGQSIPVVDTDSTPIGLLGWDDAVRFALAHGGDDPCWSKPVGTAARTAITPIAEAHRFDAGVITVRDAAMVMLGEPAALGGMNDAQQFWTAGGAVTPAGLLGAIFG